MADLTNLPSNPGERFMYLSTMAAHSAIPSELREIYNVAANDPALYQDFIRAADMFRMIRDRAEDVGEYQLALQSAMRECIVLVQNGSPDTTQVHKERILSSFARAAQHHCSGNADQKQILEDGIRVLIGKVYPPDTDKELWAVVAGKPISAFVANGWLQQTLEAMRQERNAPETKAAPEKVITFSNKPEERARQRAELAERTPPEKLLEVYSQAVADTELKKCPLHAAAMYSRIFNAARKEGCFNVAVSAACQGFSMLNIPGVKYPADTAESRDKSFLAAGKLYAYASPALQAWLGQAGTALVGGNPDRAKQLLEEAKKYTSYGSHEWLNPFLEGLANVPHAAPKSGIEGMEKNPVKRARQWGKFVLECGTEKIETVLEKCCHDSEIKQHPAVAAEMFNNIYTAALGSERYNLAVRAAAEELVMWGKVGNAVAADRQEVAFVNAMQLREHGTPKLQGWLDGVYAQIAPPTAPRKNLERLLGMAQSNVPFPVSPYLAQKLNERIGGMKR